MAAIVLAVIIAMAVVLGAGELSNKADPTTTTYTPRPEWYFFFLFEVLRVIKPPELTPLATIGVPTIALVLLAAAAVLRPQPRAAAGAPPDRDHRRDRDDRRDGLPHLPRRARRGAGQDRPEGAGQPGGGPDGREPVGLRRVPQVRRGGQRRRWGRI